MSVTRVVALALLSLLGTTFLMRAAPGYFADAREMDSRYGEQAQASLERERDQGSTSAVALNALRSIVRGDLGQSRQFDVPVSELIRPRAFVTARLLLASIACGWCVALLLALILSARRTSRGEAAISAPSALLLATPVGALSIVCMTAQFGGPFVVLTAVVAARDFKFVYRLLRDAWSAPHLFYAKAQGISPPRLALHHMLPPLRGELLSLAMASVAVALSAVVPVEVIFDVPGLGQLAWSAAMNRDLPVLLAVTLIVALCIGAASVFTHPRGYMERAQCA